jgi:hypothetical protein
MTEHTPSTPSASPDGASRLLSEVSEVRNRTRTHLQSYWFPVTLFGAITILSAPFTLIGDGVGVGIFWSIVGPLGGALTGVYYRHREQRLGVGSPALPYILTAVAMMAGAFLLPVIITGPAQASVSSYSIAIGYVVFGLLERSKMLAAVGLLIATIPTVVIVTDIANPGLVTALLTGAIMMASGMIRRRVELMAELTVPR